VLAIDVKPIPEKGVRVKKEGSIREDCGHRTGSRGTGSDLGFYGLPPGKYRILWTDEPIDYLLDLDPEWLTKAAEHPDDGLRRGGAVESLAQTPTIPFTINKPAPAPNSRSSKMKRNGLDSNQSPHRDNRRAIAAPNASAEGENTKLHKKSEK
jgi:hypothetical protein